MKCDALLTFCDDTALNTGGAGSYILGNQVDLGVARNIGVGVGEGQLFLVITVQTTADSAGGAATGAFALVTDTDPALGSPVVIVSTAAIAEAALVQGAAVAVLALPITSAYERYIGIRQTTAGEAFTAGKINAFLTTTPPAAYAYPDGI